MNSIELQSQVLRVLGDFQGIEPLKTLFWSTLNYDRVNTPIGRRTWPDATSSLLADDPLLLASGGEGGDFKVIYSRLALNRLSTAEERVVTTRLLKDHASYGLFVFSDCTQTHWHFLNVKYAEDSPSRLFRRLSVGPTERLRTASEIVTQLDLEKIGSPSSTLSPLAIQRVHDSAFNIEPVQKQFFRTFAFLYHDIADDIASISGLSDVAGQQAQLLLDRMLFLYFIQKKGWLNQQLDYLHRRFQEHWRKNPNGSSFYAEVLTPLFLCLANKDVTLPAVGDVPFLNGGLFEEVEGKTQSDRLTSARLAVRNRTFKKLFDELLERFNFTVTEDTLLDVEVAIDPEMLGRVFESLILQLDKEPSKDLRKLTGSYYTRRPIVHMMCSEALRQYLLSATSSRGIELSEQALTQLLHLPPVDELDEAASASLHNLVSPAEATALRDLLLNCRICDPAVGSGAFPVGMLHEIVTTIGKLDVRIHGSAVLCRQNYLYQLKRQIIERCLYGVDVQEQAVRLCELRLWLSLIVDYQLDSTEAFEVSIRRVPSLPNLSYRIMRGDSLLERLFGHSVQLDRSAADDRTSQIIDSIGADKQAYFHETRTREKRSLELKILLKQVELAQRLVETKRASLRSHNLSLFGESKADAKLREEREAEEQQLNELAGRIRRAEKELKAATKSKMVDRGGLEALRRRVFQAGDQPSFIWRMDFAEVFRDRGGFDIVIGNPPYFNVETLGKGSETVEALQRFYPEIWMDKSDILFYFISLGLRIQNPNGTLVLITSRSYIEATKAENLRAFLAKAATPLTVIDFRGLRLFDEAGIATSIVVSRSSIPTGTTLNRPVFVLQVGDWQRSLDVLAETLQSSLSTRDERSDSSLRSFSIDRRSLSRHPWNFTAPGIQRLFDNIDTTGKPLNEVAMDLGRGMQSGRNRIFGVSAETVNEFELELDWLRLYAANSDIDSFDIRNRNRYLIYVEDATALSQVPPNITRYLKRNKTELQKRAACQRGNCKWWQYTWPLHKAYYGNTHRLISPYRSSTNRFAFDDADAFLSLDDTTVVFVDRESPLSVYAIEAMLNSRLLTFRYRGIGKLTGQNSWEYFDYGLGRLPIKLPQSSHEKSVSQRLADLGKAVHERPDDRSELIAEIDDVVFRYYKVTPADCRVIDAEMVWASFGSADSQDSFESAEA